MNLLLVISFCAAALVAGCGSATVAELPPAAGPVRAPAPATKPAGRTFAGAKWSDAPVRATSAAGPSTTLRGGSLRAVVHGRARTLELIDTASGKRVAEEAAGVGPSQVACAPQGPCFVVDTGGDALLVFRVGPGGHELRLTRRVYTAGTPYAITIDPKRRRLWVTLTARNELVELGAHGRPHILQRLPTVRQPDAVAVDPATGDVLVMGRTPDDSGKLMQLLPDPASPDR